MKVAIMQPYFMPYLGYFALIKHVDLFILFDTPQFIRHGWIERNRVLSLTQEPFYIKVPLKKHPRSTPINHIQIDNRLQWKEKILSQLLHYKKKAPNYNPVHSILDDIFKSDTEKIAELNYLTLRLICDYLDIKTPIKIFSQMDLELEAVKAPDEWALHISKAIGARTYYNPPNGRSFFDKSKYDAEGIDLKFLELQIEPYPQFGDSFVPALSVLDALMFCDPIKINRMLDHIKVS